MFSTCKHGCVRRYPKPSGDFRVAIWGYDSGYRTHPIFCERCRSDLIRCDRMRSQTLCRQLSEFLKMHREQEAGQKVCLKCFFTTTVNRFHIIIFAFLNKEEMRSGTHFTQQNVFLLFTVVVTKHVWPYFQSRFPKTSSERVSSNRTAMAIEIASDGDAFVRRRHLFRLL